MFVYGSKRVNINQVLQTGPNIQIPSKKTTVSVLLKCKQIDPMIVFLLPYQEKTTSTHAPNKPVPKYSLKHLIGKLDFLLNFHKIKDF